MLTWLPASPVNFPPIEQALEEPDGLLAAGGALTPEWLLAAYARGIFPWYGEEQPILWWSPDPRLVLFPHELKRSRSLAKRLRNGGFTVSFDQLFSEVMQQCGDIRADKEGTWISEEMKEAYTRLHTLGYAHSVEVWQNNQLVGGLYGIALGRIFFGESMFSHVNDASKVALVYLVEHLISHNFVLIDCQVRTPHLTRLGAREIERQEFMRYLDQYAVIDLSPTHWANDQ
ncbi:leucyl/phenylalanyl-tRNA--protein transferase [Phytohalomonas tamaricis]|uniref:leucyl/phenylalanyl-tRNA--protein transferase n=1 Tax=Phytohalomonas tamaricis TaxID=2081032 RepID=UPI000D0AEE0A|nr:leucyl/phenylalanyl-tRNA--protein transferase [Phytohalomonas tamaricis]